MHPHWEQCLADFLRTLAMRSQDTSASYDGTLRRFFAQHTPDKVTRRDVEAFAYAPHARGAPSIATINVRLSAISSFYRYASAYVPEGAQEPLWKLANPATGIRHGTPERTFQTLSYEEFERFFEVIPRDTVMGLRDRAIFLMYFWSARRRSEIARLTWGDIERAVIIEANGTRRMGWIYTFRSKGHGREDDVAELPAPAMEAISRYLVAEGRQAAIKPEDPLFLAIGRLPSGNVRPGEVRQLSARGIVNRLKVYAARAGLDFSLHVFRHTAARQRYEAGEGVVEIQRLLRHTSLDHTYRYLETMAGTSDSGAKLLEAKYGHFS
jgi:integrase